MKQDKHVIGSDEVGKSDYFGPMVICSVSFNEKQNLDIFTSMRDSKKISFTQASNIFHNHKHRFNYSINIIDSKVMFKFLSLKSYNLNHFLYYFHFLTTLSIAKKQKEKNNWIVIVDDFTNGSKKNQDRYFSETSDLLTQYIKFPSNFHKKMHFIPKADNVYVENKIASIFAKHFFYEEIKKIASQIKKYNVKLEPRSLLGNSKETKNLILELSQQMPTAILKQYLKSIYWERFHL